MNPFDFARPVRDPAMFFGRRELRREVLEGVRRGASFAIIGGTRIGKTSLLFQVRNALLEELRSTQNTVIGPVFLSTHEFPRLSQSLIYRKVIEEFRLTMNTQASDEWVEERRSPVRRGPRGRRCLSRVPAGARHDLPVARRRSAHRRDDRRGRRVVALRMVALVLQQPASPDQPDDRRRTHRDCHRGHAGDPFPLRSRGIAVPQRHSGHEDTRTALARGNRGTHRAADELSTRPLARVVDLLRDRWSPVPHAVPDEGAVPEVRRSVERRH